MRRNDAIVLGDMYGKMLNVVKHTINLKESKTGPGSVDLKDKKAGKVTDGGPSKKGGFNKALNDEENVEIDCEEDEQSKDSGKNRKEKLNKGMRKSHFDTIVEKVLKENWGVEDAENEDIDALGLGDATPDSDLEGDFGDEGDDDMGGEDDTVTLTIDRATAQTLIDLLQAAVGGDVEDDMGGEEDDFDFGGDEGDDDMGGEDDSYDEDEETTGVKPFPDKKKAFQSKSNKVGGKVTPAKKKASADVTDDVGNDGDMGTAISSPKKAKDGKSNKVGSLKQGQDFFK